MWHNTGKYTVHICVKLKLYDQNLTFLFQNVTLMTKWHILAPYANTFRSEGTHLSTLYKTLQSLILTVYSEGIFSGGTFSNNQKSKQAYSILYIAALYIAVRSIQIKQKIYIYNNNKKNTIYILHTLWRASRNVSICWLLYAL